MHLILFISSCRDPSMLRTPEWPKQDTEPADPHLGSLPSAPPLPEAQANALYTASSSQSAGLGDAERHLYPSLYTSTHPGSALRPSPSQSRQTHEGGQTGGGSLGSADGRGGQSAAASPAVKPASSLGWAVQTAAGASSAAVTALSAWLPWQHDSSASSAPQQEPQQKPQAAPQSGRSTRRCAGTFLDFQKNASPCKWS